jgi:exosortase K
LTFLRRNGFWLVLAACLAFGIKYHYSRAEAGQLKWILAPTTRLVEALSGDHFIWETHAGYFSQEQRFLIAPSCAGINFLIMAFAMSAWFALPRLSSHRRRCLAVFLALAGAYGLAILINTLRIILSLYTKGYQAPFGLDPSQVHRLTGIVVYFTSLMVLYTLLQRVFPGKGATVEARS